jgi:cell fate regulator YaaT (PSP1 superfamily)
MYQIAQIKTTKWDQIYNNRVGDLKLLLGDYVVVKTEWGTEIGRIIGLQELANPSQAVIDELETLCLIIRKATTEDLEIMSAVQKQEPAALEYCKESIERYQLPMKVIDAHFSFDGSRLIFPFIADGRIDFRQLVKDLTHHFQKSIRLQQIGIRDEAKIFGDFGSCGRGLCCKSHIKELSSITSELADIQQVAHRGSERLSGQCGRLRCCLAFEEPVYRELAAKLPPINSVIKTPQGKGKVVSWNILKQTVNVVLENDPETVIETPINK